MTLERLTRHFIIAYPQRSVPGGLYFPHQRVLVVDQPPTDHHDSLLIVDISRMSQRQAGRAVFSALRRRQVIKGRR